MPIRWNSKLTLIAFTAVAANVFACAANAEDAVVCFPLKSGGGINPVPTGPANKPWLFEASRFKQFAAQEQKLVPKAADAPQWQYAFKSQLGILTEYDGESFLPIVRNPDAVRTLNQLQQVLRSPHPIQSGADENIQKALEIIQRYNTTTPEAQ